MWFYALYKISQEEIIADMNNQFLERALSFSEGVYEDLETLQGWKRIHKKSDHIAIGLVFSKFNSLYPSLKNSSSDLTAQSELDELWKTYVYKFFNQAGLQSVTVEITNGHLPYWNTEVKPYLLEHKQERRNLLIRKK